MEDFLKHVANDLRGPGGAIAVVQDGQLIAQYVYGYADIDRRIQVTPETIFPICSISKQMTCLVMADLERNPTQTMIARGGSLYEQLTAELKKLLPHLFEHKDVDLKIEHLYNMQSGIRDYWAMTTLWGARPTDPFSLLHSAPAALARTRSFHFTPGTEYSYSNVNFHVLGRCLEIVSGHSLPQLLAQRVFIPANMSTASLAPNSAAHPLPIVGYEFTEKLGYMPAENRIEWAGDAGNLASLSDMVAYEKYLHASWKDESSNYRTIAKPQVFSDGSPAEYGYGLGREERGSGPFALGHGGALRGFRLGRTHVPDAKLSVVVLLNHEGDPKGAIDTIIDKVLGNAKPTASIVEAAPEWTGWFYEDSTGLLVRVEPEGKLGKVNIKYGAHGDSLALVDVKTAATSAGMTASIDCDHLTVTRPREGHTIQARRISKPGAEGNAMPEHGGFAGVYRCEESDSTFTCTGDGGVLYGAFDGYINKGPIWPMRYAGEDTWALANTRALDSTPPGDWTCKFKRDSSGSVNEVTIGCWLARKLHFVRMS